MLFFFFVQNKIKYDINENLLYYTIEDRAQT